MRFLLKKNVINSLSDTEEQKIRYFLSDFKDAKNDVSKLFQKYDLMHNTCSMPSTSITQPLPLVGNEKPLDNQTLRDSRSGAQNKR